jgi:hypothetical protein
MRATIRKISFVLLALAVFAVPSMMFAATITKGITTVCTNGPGGTSNGECTFGDLWAAVQNVVNWATGFALSFSVVVIAWAGYNYLISGDNPSKRRDANRMLTKVVTGIVLMLAAWLIVKLITTALGVDTGISNLG